MCDLLRQIPRYGFQKHCFSVTDILQTNPDGFWRRNETKTVENENITTRSCPRRGARITVRKLGNPTLFLVRVRWKYLNYGRRMLLTDLEGNLRLRTGPLCFCRRGRCINIIKFTEPPSEFEWWAYLSTGVTPAVHFLFTIGNRTV